MLYYSKYYQIFTFLPCVVSAVRRREMYTSKGIYLHRNIMGQNQPHHLWFSVMILSATVVNNKLKFLLVSDSAFIHAEGRSKCH